MRDRKPIEHSIHGTEVNLTFETDWYRFTPLRERVLALGGTHQGTSTVNQSTTLCFFFPVGLEEEALQFYLENQ